MLEYALTLQNAAALVSKVSLGQKPRFNWFYSLFQEGLHLREHRAFHEEVHCCRLRFIVGFTCFLLSTWLVYNNKWQWLKSGSVKSVFNDSSKTAKLDNLIRSMCMLTWLERWLDPFVNKMWVFRMLHKSFKYWGDLISKRCLSRIIGGISTRPTL